MANKQILTKFFISLGVSEAVAKADACLIEHDLSPETFDAVCKYIKDKGLAFE